MEWVSKGITTEELETEHVGCSLETFYEGRRDPRQ